MLGFMFFLRNSEMSLRTPEGTSSFRDAICNEKIEVFFESYSQQNGMASWVSNIARTWHPCNCFFFSELTPCLFILYFPVLYFVNKGMK